MLFVRPIRGEEAFENLLDGVVRYRIGRGDSDGGLGSYRFLRNEATIFLELLKSVERFVEAALGGS